MDIFVFIIVLSVKSFIIVDNSRNVKRRIWCNFHQHTSTMSAVAVTVATRIETIGESLHCCNLFQLCLFVQDALRGFLDLRMSFIDSGVKDGYPYWFLVVFVVRDDFLDKFQVLEPLIS